VQPAIAEQVSRGEQGQLAGEQQVSASGVDMKPVLAFGHEIEQRHVVDENLAMGDIRDKPKLVHGVILPSSTTPRTSLARRHPPPRSSDARRGHAVGAALGPQTPAGRSAPSALRGEPSTPPVFSAWLSGILDGRDQRDHPTSRRDAERGTSSFDRLYSTVRLRS
jgi:hypothetical protein